MIERLRPETTYSAVVGRVVAMRRQRCRLDQAEIAAKVRVSQPTWSRIETGESALTVEQLALAARALRASPTEILEQADQAVAGLKRRGVAVQYGSTKEFAKQGLALIGAVALGVLILSVLSRK